ncbi:MAG: hypothetical protein WCD79_02840 [Chthoniobacteraceae bacterium]
MDKKTLSTVAVKILGLWLILPDIAQMISDLIYLLFSKIKTGTFGSNGYFTWHPHALLDFDRIIRIGFGLAVIRYASLVVEKLFKPEDLPQIDSQGTVAFIGAKALIILLVIMAFLLFMWAITQ